MRALILTLFLLAPIWASGQIEPTVAVVVSILHDTAVTGDAGHSKNVALYMAERASEADREWFRLLLTHLRNDSWSTILPETQSRMEAFGFSFVDAGPHQLIPALTRELFSGINLKSLKARETMAVELATLFPDAEIFRFIVAELGEIRNTVIQRKSLAMKLGAQREQLKEMTPTVEAKSQAERLNDRRRAIRNTSQHHARKAAEQEARNQVRYQVLETDAQYHALPDPRQQLRTLIAEVEKRLRHAEMTGEF